MALVGSRSIARFVGLSVIYVGFAIVAFTPDAGLVVRLGSALLAAFGLVEAVGFWHCVRSWRFEGQDALLPTLRDSERHVLLSELAQIEMFGGGPVRFLHGLPDDPTRGYSQLSLNVYVSTVDFQRWLEAAQVESK